MWTRHNNTLCRIIGASSLSGQLATYTRRDNHKVRLTRQFPVKFTGFYVRSSFFDNLPNIESYERRLLKSFKLFYCQYTSAMNINSCHFITL